MKYEEFFRNGYSSQDDFICPCDKIRWHLFANFLFYHSDVEDFVLGRTKHHSKAILDQDRHLVARGSHRGQQNTFFHWTRARSLPITNKWCFGDVIDVTQAVEDADSNSSMLLRMLMLRTALAIASKWLTTVVLQFSERSYFLVTACLYL